jgi:F0F1-type ATP synthase membrane subunit b/b'
MMKKEFELTVNQAKEEATKIKEKASADIENEKKTLINEL